MYSIVSSHFDPCILKLVQLSLAIVAPTRLGLSTVFKTRQSKLVVSHQPLSLDKQSFSIHSNNRLSVTTKAFLKLMLTSFWSRKEYFLS